MSAARGPRHPVERMQATTACVLLVELGTIAVLEILALADAGELGRGGDRRGSRS